MKETYIKPSACVVVLDPESSILGFSQGSEIITPNRSNSLYYDDEI